MSEIGSRECEPMGPMIPIEAQRLCPRRYPTLLLRMAAPVVLICAVGACRGGSEADPPAAGQHTSSPTGSSRQAAEDQALEAYRGMWRAYATAGLTANPDEPELARYAAGDALTTLTSGLAGYRAKGQVLKGQYRSTPKVAGASSPTNPSSVSIVDCLDDSDFLVYRLSGEPVNDEPGGRRATRATVTELGGEWKVVSFGVQGVGTC